MLELPLYKKISAILTAYSARNLGLIAGLIAVFKTKPFFILYFDFVERIRKKYLGRAKTSEPSKATATQSRSKKHKTSSILLYRCSTTCINY